MRPTYLETFGGGLVTNAELGVDEKRVVKMCRRVVKGTVPSVLAGPTKLEAKATP